MFTLDKCIKEKTMRVIKVNGEYLLKRRLFDLGFLPDEKLKCVLISPFGDPKAYYINGNLLALRNREAKYIEVTYE